MVISVILVTAAVARLAPPLVTDARWPLSILSNVISAVTPKPKTGTTGSLPAIESAGSARADVEELEREEQEIGTLIRESQSRGNSIVQRLVWPLPENSQISSPFGMRQHPILNVQVLHAGIDIAAKSGLPIEACGKGKVIAVKTLEAYGSIVIIDHGGKQATVYAHLSAIDVAEGQTVSRGEVIGKVGRTGRVTGPHLHLEVRVNGDPVNPHSHFQPPK